MENQVIIYGQNIDTGVISPIPVAGDGQNLVLKIGSGTGDVSWDDVLNKPDFKDIATTAEYSDLLNVPVLATVATTGAYADLSGTPTLATVATSGSYDDLTNKPSISAVGLSGEYSDLLNAPILATVATSGAYADLSGTPTLSTVATSGSYDDLTNKPSISAVGLSGEYSDLLNAPVLATVATSGSYNDLLDKPSIPASIDDMTDVQITDPVNGEALIYQDGLWVDGSYSYNDLIDKPDFLENVVIVNESETTLSAALAANTGQALHFQLGTGSFTEAGPINITSQNCLIGSLASCRTAVLTEFSQAQINLSVSSTRMRLVNMSIDGVLQISTQGGNVNHSVADCVIGTGLYILSGTVATGSRFLRFTDCEINNLSIGDVNGCDIYFTRCIFTGTFTNNITTPNKVFFVDCTGLPYNLYGLALVGGHTQFTNQTVEVNLGYGSAAKLRTSLLADTTNSNLVYTNELGQTRVILDSAMKLTNSQLANSNIVIGGQTIALGGSGSLAFSNITGYLNSEAQIENGNIANAKLVNSNVIIGGQTIELGGSGSLAFSNITGSLNTGTQIDNGNIANAKLVNSNVVIGGQTIELGGSGSLAFSNITGFLNSGTQIENGNIANAKLVNSSVTFNGNTVSLGGSAVIPIDALGNTNISYTGIENHSVLCYHTSTSLWEQHKLSYADLSDVNVPVGSANGSIVFYNSSTQQLEATTTPNVDAIYCNNSNILIGRQRTVPGTSTHNIIFNTVPSTIITPTQPLSGGFYINTASLRSTTFATQRLRYLPSSYEVTRCDDTLENLANVGNSADSVDGGPVRYISSTGSYAARCAQYWSYAGYGQLSAYTVANTEKAILQTNGTTVWATFTPNAAYTFPSGKFTHDTATGILSGFDSTKHYKVEFHVSQNGNNINPAAYWFARIRENNSTGPLVRDVRIMQASDDRAPSLHAVVIITGITALYFGYGLSGTYTTIQNPDCQVSICCHEL